MHAIKIPGAPDNWSHPAAKTEQGEPSFENIDNPGGWSSFTFRSEYEKGRGTGDYKLHRCHLTLDNQNLANLVKIGDFFLLISPSDTYEKIVTTQILTQDIDTFHLG